MRTLLALFTAVSAFAAPRLDTVTDTLQLDDGVPLYAFRFPDAYGDDFRNMRFQVPAESRLIGALFAFATEGFHRWTTGSPSLVTVVWATNEDSTLPSTELTRDTLSFDLYSGNVFDLDSIWINAPNQLVFVDLSNHNLPFDSGRVFHIGYTAVRSRAEDSIAILSDDGIFPTDNASEFYNGRFELMRGSWGGVNLFIRAIIEIEDLSASVLSPVSTSHLVASSFPNPFNSSTTISVTTILSTSLTLSIYNVLGQRVEQTEVRAESGGDFEFKWSPRALASSKYLAVIESGSTRATIQLVYSK